MGSRKWCVYIANGNERNVRPRAAHSLLRLAVGSGLLEFRSADRSVFADGAKVTQGQCGNASKSFHCYSPLLKGKAAVSQQTNHFIKCKCILLYNHFILLRRQK